MPTPPGAVTGHRPGPGVIGMENEVLLTGMFLGAGLLAYVVLVIGDRVLDHMGDGQGK